MLDLITIIAAIFAKKVYADYCAFGLCEEENRYCCGVNKCCDKTDFTFIWVGIFIVGLALAIMFGLRHFVKKKRNNNDYSYQLVTDQNKPEET